MLQSLQVSGPSYPPHLKNIGEKQISEAIAAADKSDEREYQDRKSIRKFGLAYTLIIFGFLAFLTIVLLKSHPDLYSHVLTAIVTALISFAGGYGYGQHKISR